VLINIPDGVVNIGEDTPVIVIVNVLSRILFKLSVARIVNETMVSRVTIAGIPVSKPVLVFKTKLAGNVPDNKLYLTLVPGATGAATKAKDIEYP
jgi:hypothetical protein